MFAFIAAISQASGIIIDKIVLTRRQMSIHVFIPVLFMFLMALSAVLMPFLGTIDSSFISTKYLLLFLAMIVTAIIWNIFYYQGAQKEKVQEFELIIMFQPLFTILLAAVLIEKNVSCHLFIAAILASLALIGAHIKKDHIALDSAGWGLIVAVVFMSIEIIIQKMLLTVYSPVALYFTRTLILFLFFYFYYRPRVEKVSPINAWLLLSSAALGVGQMVTKFYGFDAYGVIYTSLILILAPVLVYILSSLMLHERLKPQTIISALVILLCIVYATLFK